MSSKYVVAVLSEIWGIPSDVNTAWAASLHSASGVQDSNQLQNKIVNKSTIASNQGMS